MDTGTSDIPQASGSQTTRLTVPTAGVEPIVQEPYDHGPVFIEDHWRRSNLLVHVALHPLDLLPATIEAFNLWVPRRADRVGDTLDEDNDKLDKLMERKQLAPNIRDLQSLQIAIECYLGSSRKYTTM